MLLLMMMIECKPTADWLIDANWCTGSNDFSIESLFTQSVLLYVVTVLNIVDDDQTFLSLF